MNGNTYATPSEDDFSDDDDELLIAASQQVEKKLAQEKVGAAARNVNALQLQGEIAILRDHNLKLAREKDQQRIKQTEEIKSIEQKYKKDLENMKSKLEFKERDIEELKSKVRTDHSRNDMTQSAKRPRLSVVKETKPAKKSSAPSPCQSNDQFRIRTFQTPSAVALSKFSSLQLTDLNSDLEQRNLALFYRGLRNNPGIQKRFNIKPFTQKCPPSKEVTSTIAHLFKQYDQLAEWSEKRVCLRTLSVLLPHNSYHHLEQEMKKLLAAFQKSSSEEEHSTLADTLHHSGVNVFTLCAGGGGSCLLAALYRYKCRQVISVLISSILQVTNTVQHCFCSDRMVKYICDLIEECLQGDLSSTTLLIVNETLLIQCLQLLSSLAPFFPDMKLSVTSQTMFFGSLSHLKKCPKLSMSGLAMVDVLYEAVFELDTSMSA